MANPITRMQQHKRMKIQNRICRHADPGVAIDSQSDARPVMLYAGHAPVDLMRYIIGVLFATK